MGTLGGIPLDVGDVLAKKYRLEKLVGEGGTGIVVAARHVQLDQRVAIKFLRTALASEEIRLRFEREARAISKIESEHVVLVLDVGAVDDATPYMVMEYLEGRDLARVIKEDGPLAVGDAIDCMLQVCEALAEAHAAGIVHRDLKPANLFLTRREDGGPHIKVVDFGISKILDKKLLAEGRGPAEVTSEFTVLGSPRYMAPEQLRNSKDVDARADLWSVGAVLFQLVTGKHAFDAETNVEASLAVLTKEPARLSDVAPGAPPELEAIVARCLTKDVAGRYQSARDLAGALRPFASDNTRDSLERMRRAKGATSLVDIALSASSVSSDAPGDAPPSRPPPPSASWRPPPVSASHPPPPSSPRGASTSVPTAPSAFRVSQRPPAAPPSEREPVERLRTAFARSPSRALKIAMVAGGAVAVLLVFGLLTMAKLAAQSLGLVDSPEAPPAAAAAVGEPVGAPVVATTAEPPSQRVVIPLDAGRARP